MDAHAVRFDIQGLRALAIIGVVIFHVDSTILPGGFSGVDIFFVISGFILSRIILNQRNNFSWFNFYWERIKRIMPAYFVMLAIVSIISAIFFIASDFSIYKSSLVSASRFTSNHFFANFENYFAPQSTEYPLLHTWSLAIEIQIYIFLPIILIFLSLKKIKLILPILLISGLLYSEWRLSSDSNTQIVYFSLLARVHEFLVGTVVAVFCCSSTWKPFSRAIAGHFGLMLIAISYLSKVDHQFPGFRSLIPCLGAALMIMARGEGFSSRWLSRTWMVWLGGLSYSLYLWHWPILSFIRYYTQSYSLTLWSLVLFGVLAAVMSWSSWKFIELPARQCTLQRTLIARKTYAWLVALLVPLLGSSALNAKMIPGTLPKSIRYASPESICHGKIIGNCLRGAVGFEPMALVIGDSHAAQLNHFFDVIGVEKNFSVQLVSASSCVPITNFDVRRIAKSSQSECKSQIEFVNNSLTSFKILFVAAKWSYQIQSSDFVDAFEVFLKNAELKKQRVIVMAQIPKLNGNPIRAVRFRYLGFNENIWKTDEALKSNEIIEKIISKYPNVVYLDYTSNAFFNKLPYYKEEAVYMDNHHLNEIGSKYYGHAVGSDLYSQVLLTQLKY